MKFGDFRLSADGTFRSAVRFAVVAGTAFGAPAIAQTGATAEKEAAVELDTVEVTGSRIRRVDMENVNPVFTIDRSTIKASGVTTLGELIQELPSIAGNATNPQVNNGGGDGAAEISLRGLGEDRTLMLLNGRRLVQQDVNSIPIGLIERVEVLNEGASAIYGSDAIAGVVNFITRRDYTGGEISYDFGVTSKNDGQRQSVNLNAGTTTGNASFMVGLTYNKQEAVLAKDRDFSKFALYLYGGEVFAGGSSRAPRGRIFLPSADWEDNYDCVPEGDPVPQNISVTRIPGAEGDVPEDYRCFGAADFYNYQAVGNLILTPQERTGLFTVGNYQINDQIEAYAEIFTNGTTSGYAIAPLPFDARLDDVVLSADSVYNPFDIDFGGSSGENTNFLTRLEALGNRRTEFNSRVDQANLGLDGLFDFLDATWKWDAGLTYGRRERNSDQLGYLYQPAVAAALGPSFIDADGTPTCGTVDDPIPNCTPVNFFNLSAEGQVDALRTLSANAGQRILETLKLASMNVSGDVAYLKAGPVGAAIGMEYREHRLTGQVDFLARDLPPDDAVVCYLAQETCTNATDGSYNVNELYAEVLVPILRDMPFAQSLNVSLGTRFSDYSNFGSTTNSKIGIEYRPMGDLLVRSTFGEVFRAPRIDDLYQPVTANAPNFNDPCVGLTQEQVDDPNTFYEEACENVATDGTFEQPNSQVTGLVGGNPNLDPETGTVLTLGAVYDPSWLPGFSTGVTVWDYEVEDQIVPLDVNTIAQQCVETGNPAFCDRIERFSDGSVRFIDQPTDNLGELATQGVDFGAKYAWDNPPQLFGMDLGRFKFSADMTYISKFDNKPAPAFSNDTVHVAGTFDRQYGNFSRIRGTGGVHWSQGPFEGQWILRHIGKFRVIDADGAPGTQPAMKVGSHTYHSVTLGYNLESLSTWFKGMKAQIGGDNIFDKQPPVLFQNNVINANTDVETFDTVGSFYWARVSKSF